jgi:ABC-2 type transport system ATP-binding protein
VNEQTEEHSIVLDNVSKFYGDVLGVNRVSLAIPPGITSMVGPNGSGKTTLMNLITGLIQPSQGDVWVLGIPVWQPERLFRRLGYCTQYDSFPKGLTGRQLLCSWLGLQGYPRREAEAMAEKALLQVGLTNSSDRRIAGYSKGMRQRIKLAQAICHEPDVLILDEPLNGLDPLARAEMIALFRELAGRGSHVVISSHILHDVDLISDRVVLLNNGFVVAEGNIHGVRDEMQEHPRQFLIRCSKPSVLAAHIFDQDQGIEVRLHEDRLGLMVKTHTVGQFFLLMNQVVLEHDLEVEFVAPADEDVHSVYEYLIGTDGGRS